MRGLAAGGSPDPEDVGFLLNEIGGTRDDLRLAVDAHPGRVEARRRADTITEQEGRVRDADVAIKARDAELSKAKARANQLVTEAQVKHDTEVAALETQKSEAVAGLAIAQSSLASLVGSCADPRIVRELAVARERLKLARAKAESSQETVSQLQVQSQQKNLMEWQRKAVSSSLAAALAIQQATNDAAWLAAAEVERLELDACAV